MPGEEFRGVPPHDKGESPLEKTWESTLSSQKEMADMRREHEAMKIANDHRREDLLRDKAQNEAIKEHIQSMADPIAKAKALVAFEEVSERTKNVELSIDAVDASLEKWLMRIDECEAATKDLYEQLRTDRN